MARSYYSASTPGSLVALLCLALAVNQAQAQGVYYLRQDFYTSSTCPSTPGETDLLVYPSTCSPSAGGSQAYGNVSGSNFLAYSCTSGSCGSCTLSNYSSGVCTSSGFDYYYIKNSWTQGSQPDTSAPAGQGVYTTYSYSTTGCKAENLTKINHIYFTPGECVRVVKDSKTWVKRTFTGTTLNVQPCLDSACTNCSAVQARTFNDKCVTSLGSSLIVTWTAPNTTNGPVPTPSGAGTPSVPGVVPSPGKNGESLPSVAHFTVILVLLALLF